MIFNSEEYLEQEKREKEARDNFHKYAMLAINSAKELWYWNKDGGYLIDNFKYLVETTVPKSTHQCDGYKKQKITSSTKKQVFERDKYRCKHCGTHLNLSVDHIIPESKGGKSEMDNFQTLCRSCNSRKGAR